MGRVHAAHAAGVEVDVLGRAGRRAGARAELLDLVLRLLRHRAGHGHQAEREAAGRVAHAVEAGHPARARRRERELRARGEVRVRELLTGLAERAQALPDRPVLALEPGALGVGEAGGAVLPELERAGHGQVRAHARQRLEHLVLGLVEPVAQRGDRDHQAHAEAEAERGQERAAPAPAELRRDVGEVEQGRATASAGEGRARRSRRERRARRAAGRNAALRRTGRPRRGARAGRRGARGSRPPASA